MFGVASVEPDEENIVSLLCDDANQVDDVYEREYKCKTVVTNGKRRCAFNKQTAMCESLQDLVEEEMVKAIRSGTAKSLVPVTNFADQMFARDNPELNTKMELLVNQLAQQKKSGGTPGFHPQAPIISIHPLAQLGAMLLLYVSRGMVFSKLENSPLWQDLVGLMGVNALRMLFDALTGSRDGTAITRVATTLLKLFLPESFVDFLLLTGNVASIAGLWSYFTTPK